MKYRVVKYKPRKKRRKPLLETYEPKRRVEFSKEHAVPFLVRIGQRFVVLGGTISFFASSFLIAIKGFFSIEKKIKEKARKFSFNRKVVEIRIKEK